MLPLYQKVMLKQKAQSKIDWAFFISIKIE